MRVQKRLNQKRLNPERLGGRLERSPHRGVYTPSETRTWSTGGGFTATLTWRCRCQLPSCRANIPGWGLRS